MTSVRLVYVCPAHDLCMSVANDICDACVCLAYVLRMAYAMRMSVLLMTSVCVAHVIRLAYVCVAYVCLPYGICVAHDIRDAYVCRAHVLRMKYVLLMSYVLRVSVFVLSCLCMCSL